MDTNRMCTFDLCLWGPLNHEKEAIFSRKMGGFRMFSGFWEREARKNPEASHNAKGQMDKRSYVLMKIYDLF